MTNVQQVTATVRDACDTIVRRRKLVATVFAVLVVLSIVIVFNVKRQYVAGANVLVVNGNTRDDPTLSSPDLPSIATSSVVLDRVLGDLKLDLPLTTIKKHLTVKTPAFHSSIIRIEYVDASPSRAALIANGVADELTRYYEQISTARYDADLSALNGELSAESKRIETLTRQIAARGAGLEATVDDKGNDPVAGRLEGLESDRELAKATLIGDEAGAAAVGAGAQTDAKLYRHDVLSSDQRYRDLEATVSSDNLALAAERAVHTDQFPGVVELEAKTRKLTAELNRETRAALTSPDAMSSSITTTETDQRKAVAVVAADGARVAALDTLVSNEQSRLAAQAPLASLRLALNAAQSEYLEISGRRAAALANRADALSLGSVVVVDRAIPSEVQVGLGPKTLGAVLAFLALALAIGSAFLADLLNPRLRRMGQIETLYGRPVVVTVGKAS
jgi:capsular polysaccharide biosynthesis protein